MRRRNMDVLSPDSLSARLTDLEETLENLEKAVSDAERILAFATLNKTPSDEEKEALDEAKLSLNDWKESEEQMELEDIRRLKDEMGNSWDNNEVLINEADWVEYVEELVKDIGDLPRDIPHYIVIDWDATADNIKQDYCEVTFQGTPYYYRSV